MLADYGITEGLLARRNIDVTALNLAGLTSADEVAAAIRLIQPRPTGVELKRYGGAMDGGYLVPDALDDIEACFSPGTNNFKRFEDELLRQFGVRTFMCDFSSDEHHFETPLAADQQFFQKKWLDVDGSADALDINDWVASSTNADTDLILQMDIESAEYRNLTNASDETLSRFRIIILEIHDLQNLARRDFMNGVFRPVFDRLFETHVCAHIHPNNCCGEAVLAGDLKVPCAVEATFLRKDFCRPDAERLVLPHPRDDLNVRREPPLGLSGPWLEHADEAASRIASLESSISWLTQRVMNLQEYNLFLVNHALLAGNVSLGRYATQSSGAHGLDWAGAAVNGARAGTCAFHTGLDNPSWWQVDLGSSMPLSYCLLFNRMDGAQRRADGIQVLTSEKGEDWSLQFEHRGPSFGGVNFQDGELPLLAPLNGVSARYLKLQIPRAEYLHLDSVEVFARQR